jgi:hypothetical protein
VFEVSPSFFYEGNLKVGVITGSSAVTIENEGTVAVTINTITTSHSDITLSGLPTLPITLAPGGTTNFLFTVTSQNLGFNDYDDGVVITPSVGNPQFVEIAYNGFAIVPFIPLTGATKEVLYGLGGLSGNLPVNYIAPGESNQPCEAVAFFQKILDTNNETMLAYWNQLLARFEAQNNPTPVVVSMTTILGGATATTTTDTKQRNFTLDSQGIPSSLVFDVTANGEMIKIVLTVAALAGILSMISYTDIFETRGPVYEPA